jgi:RecJ-like exonuclease
MSEECIECEGRGYQIISVERCPECKGTGKTKSVDLMKLKEQDVDNFLSDGSYCPKCEGSGQIKTTKDCETCKGRGIFYKCKVCGTSIDDPVDDEEICRVCAKSQVVYALDNSCDLDEVEVGQLYHGIVDGIAAFGVFVNLNAHIRGLIHIKNLKEELDIGDPVIVYVKEIKSNGNVDLVPKNIKEFHTIELEKELPIKLSSQMSEFIGRVVRIEGEVIQVKQTAGPTIFTISDEAGLITGAAFEKAGERAYPHIDSNMVVTATGEITSRGDEVQLEIKSMKRLSGEKEAAVWERIEKAIDERAEPYESEFLIESEILDKLKPGMKKVAKEIRKAVIKSKPIVIRHHADADGMTSAVALERAVLPLISEVSGSDAEYYLYRRSPSKAPFYELADVTKDLSFALEDMERHGQKFPLILLVDNGSTDEDTPAMRQARVYGIDMIVVDHHNPDEVVDQYLQSHINPAHAGGDFGITTGMLCTEIASMINPDVKDEIYHLPAISAVGDRSEREEATKYIDIVSDKYSLDQLENIALALDFEAFWLKFSSGKGIVNDILNFGDPMVHKNLVSILCEQANDLISSQMETCLPHVKSTILPNGAILNALDVENYAHKFSFPPPGKTAGEVHDRMCQEYENKPVITIGYGPDFTVIRSKNVKMNIPQIVRELHNEVKGGGVNGGGHLVVGSIKFVEGMRKEVLEKLAEKLGQAEIEEGLG